MMCGLFFGSEKIGPKHLPSLLFSAMVELGAMVKPSWSSRLEMKAMVGFTTEEIEKLGLQASGVDR